MVQIHRKVGGKLSNAAEPKMIGAPVVIYQTPYRYIDRNITPELIADSWKMPLIFSSVSNLIRLCFGGLDPKFTSIDGPEDDTKQKQIEQAAKQFKQIDKKLARIGFKKNCNTLECVRRGALEAWSWRKGIFEKTVSMGEGNLYAPRLQHLPGQSFNRAPTFAGGQINRYQSDEILKGIIFDTQAAEIHFYQNVDSIKEPVEIPADQVLYFEDVGVPPNTSMLHSIISTIEFMKQARHDFRLALQRIGTPKEVAEVDGGVLAQMKAQQIEITGGYQTLVDYCNNMMQTQSSNQAEVALPGTRFKYPNIPIALNPMDVEKFIEQIILNHFFAKGITEQLAQAVSVSATPAKALLDGIISGHQEAAGLPFVKMWQEDFLDANGYDLIISFNYWAWAPADQKAESEKATTIFAQGGSLVNDYRAAQGLDPYTPEQLKQLFDEQNALKRGKLPGEPESPTQPPEAKGVPLSPEELAAQAENPALSPEELAKLKEKLMPVAPQMPAGV